MCVFVGVLFLLFVNLLFCLYPRRQRDAHHVGGGEALFAASVFRCRRCRFLAMAKPAMAPIPAAAAPTILRTRRGFFSSLRVDGWGLDPKPSMILTAGAPTAPEFPLLLSSSSLSLSLS